MTTPTLTIAVSISGVLLCGWVGFKLIRTHLDHGGEFLLYFAGVLASVACGGGCFVYALVHIVGVLA